MFDYQQKLDHFARMLVPGFCVVVLLLISLSPIGVDGMAYFPIDVCLISIFYWTIFRPAALPFWFVFVLGVVRDALMGMPLGIAALVFLLFRLVILTQQRHLVRENFWTAWIGFGLIAIPALAMQWLLASAFARSLLPFTEAMMQWVFTFGFYPLLHILFNMVYRFLPPAATRSQTPML